jgi:ATP-binding cassette subfamily B protein
MRDLPVYKQIHFAECGAVCLHMIADYYNKNFSRDEILKIVGFKDTQVSLYAIVKAAKKMGFRTRAVKLTLSELIHKGKNPCLLHWNYNHFVIFFPLFPVSGGISLRIIDPAIGVFICDEDDFRRSWLHFQGNGDERLGIALLFKTTAGDKC